MQQDRAESSNSARPAFNANLDDGNVVFTTYTVTFEGNGQDIGEAYTQEMTYDQAVALKPCAFIKEGYTFSSWNIEQHGGGTSYENEQTVLNLADTQDANVHLYAQWEVVPPEETINITFDAGQGNIFILTDEGIYENQGHTYTLEGIEKDMPTGSTATQALVLCTLTVGPSSTVPGTVSGQTVRCAVAGCGTSHTAPGSTAAQVMVTCTLMVGTE